MGGRVGEGVSTTRKSTADRRSTARKECGVKKQKTSPEAARTAQEESCATVNLKMFQQKQPVGIPTLRGDGRLLGACGRVFRRKTAANAGKGTELGPGLVWRGGNTKEEATGSTTSNNYGKAEVTAEWSKVILR